MLDLENSLEWYALEYEEKAQSPDWFWALGVIIVTAAATSIIYANYFFAALLIIGGALLGFFAKKKPDLIHYELGPKGLRIGTRLYPYDNIKSFWVHTSSHLDIADKPAFFIKSERPFMPIISIPIENILAENIHQRMLEHNIIEEEMHEHPTHKIMESLGF